MAGAFEGYSWYIDRRALESQKKRGETLWRVIRRSKDPSVFTVFLEDSAALIGIALAFLGIFFGTNASQSLSGSHRFHVDRSAFRSSRFGSSNRKWGIAGR